MEFGDIVIRNRASDGPSRVIIYSIEVRNIDHITNVTPRLDENAVSNASTSRAQPEPAERDTGTTFDVGAHRARTALEYLENVPPTKPFAFPAEAARAAAGSLANRPVSAPIYTLVPEHEAIELVAYYQEFVDYYPDCELQTKRWFVENVQPNWIMFDVGANIGYYSILFSRLASEGRVYAFEPTDTIDLLRRNLDRHLITNVEMLRVALGAASGRMEEDIYGVSGHAPEQMKFDFATLDDMVGRLRLDRLDCIKIDVNSFDFEVLQGAERTLDQLNPWVVVELNHALAKRNHSVGQALEWLAARGYMDAHVLDCENYVLRRRPAANSSAIACPPELRLSFEQRPILLRDAFEKGEPIPACFGRDLVPQNAASITLEKRGDAPIISVPGPRWTNAAIWPRLMSQTVSGPLIVEVELTVTGGEVGLGCVSPAKDAYLGEEVFVPAALGRQKIVVTAPDGALVGHLLLRNTDPAGRTASVRVHRISAFQGIPASSRSLCPLLAREKRRLSLAECEAALSGIEPAPVSAPSGEPGIDIVPAEELGTALGFGRPFATERKIYRKQLADFQTETDEAAVYAYLYRCVKPARHLEFGTWEGFGAALCARSCDAEIWTINLPEGERDAAGNPLYGLAAGSPGALNFDGQVPSDSGDRIGWRYRAAGFESRVHQILCDSRNFDASQFAPGFFDTVLIDGGHQAEVVTNDTNKALPLLRAGGIMIWHDFCPDVEALRRNEAPRGVVRAVIDNFTEWNLCFSKIAWIRPSWMLIGVRI